MLYMAQPTFPIFASRWDELAQPEQTATPSSIPSGSRAAVCDIARSRWRIRIHLAQRTRGVATRGPPESAAAGAQQVGVESDVTAASRRAGGAVRRARAVTSRENSTGRGLAPFQLLAPSSPSPNELFGHHHPGSAISPEKLER